MFKKWSKCRFFYKDVNGVRHYIGSVLEDTGDFIIIQDRYEGKMFLKKSNIIKAEEISPAPVAEHECKKLRIVGEEKSGYYKCGVEGCENFLVWVKEVTTYE